MLHFGLVVFIADVKSSEKRKVLTALFTSAFFVCVDGFKCVCVRVLFVLSHMSVATCT